MKGIVALLTICFGIAAAQICEYDHGNGRPACIQVEMNRPWRNNWDPVHYWVCLTLNTPAVAVRCPNEHQFLESQLRCVHFTQWFWTPPCNPPSGGGNGGGGGGIITTVAPPPTNPITPPTSPITPPPPGPVCEYDHGDGRPACIQVEMNRPWRNNWDPVHYWVCVTLNTPAVAVRCPNEHQFLESQLRCVHFTQWFWTPKCNPPSGGNNGGGGGGIITTLAPVPPPTSPITPAPPAPSNPVCVYNHGHGRPACIQAEMNRPWRNNWDPKHYWVCLTLNTPALSVRCPNEHQFLESEQRCVPFTRWMWIPPCDPPSGHRA